MSVFTALLCVHLQAVTFHRPVEPLHAMLPELAKVTGHKLAVSPEMKWQLLFVRVKDVSPRDLYDRIAQATYGRWVRNVDDVNVLEFDKGRLARELAEKTKKRRDRIANAIAEVIKARGESEEDEPEGGGFPIELLHMLTGIGADRIAAVGLSNRVVFSTRPSRTQIPFANFKSEWLESLMAKENATRARSASRVTVPMSPEAEKARKLLDPEYWEARKPRQSGIASNQIITEPIAKLDLVLTCFEYSISVEVTGMDRSGTVEIHELGSLIIPYNVSNEPEESDNKSPTVKLSPGARRVFDYWRYEPSPQLKKDVLDFRNSDPFLSAYRECVDAYAKSTTDNLVFGIHDRRVSGGALNLTISRVEEWLREDRQWLAADGWRITIPDYRPFACNRDDVAEAVDRFGHKEIPELDDFAWLAATFDTNVYPSEELLQWVLDVLGKEIPEPDELLRVYGYLPQSEQMRLKKGEALSVSSMPTKARQILERICAGHSEEVGRLKPISEPEATDYVTTLKEIMEWEFTAMDEPTNAFPDGLPSNATFSLDLKTVTAYTGDWVWDRFGFERHQLINEAVRNLEDPEEGAKPIEVTVTKLERAMFTFQGTPTIGLREVHKILKPSPSDKKLKLEDLDADFQKTLALKLARAKQWKAYMDAIGPQGSSKDPPPPTD